MNDSIEIAKVKNSRQPFDQSADSIGPAISTPETTFFFMVKPDFHE